MPSTVTSRKPALRLLLNVVVAIALAGWSFGCFPDPNPLKTVFVIVMENQNWSAIKGNPSAAYINTLLPHAAWAEQYFTPPGLHPSLPNYLWMEAGDNFSIREDIDPVSAHQNTSEHLVALLERAGISWKSYFEGIDGNDCPLVNSGQYAVRHNPFAYFDDVTEGVNPRSANCIAHVRPYQELLTDLAQGTAARYNFIAPNLCNDMHNCGIPAGDAWLRQNLPFILLSSAYRDGGVVFIVWDEGDGAESDGPIGLIAMSPEAKTGYANDVYYTHSSLLRTIQEIFRVTPLLGGAANATDLSDLFVNFPSSSINPLTAPVVAKSRRPPSSREVASPGRSYRY